MLSSLYPSNVNAALNAIAPTPSYQNPAGSPSAPPMPTPGYQAAPPPMSQNGLTPIHQAVLANPSVPAPALAAKLNVPVGVVVQAQNDLRQPSAPPAAQQMSNSVPPAPTQINASIPPPPQIRPSIMPAPNIPPPSPQALATPAGQFNNYLAGRTSGLPGNPQTPPLPVPRVNSNPVPLTPPPPSTAPGAPGNMPPSIPAAGAASPDAQGTPNNGQGGYSGYSVPPGQYQKMPMNLPTPASAPAHHSLLQNILGGLGRVAPLALTAYAFRNNPGGGAALLGGYQQGMDRQAEERQQQVENQQKQQELNQLNVDKAETLRDQALRGADSKAERVTPLVAAAQTVKSAKAVYDGQYPNNDLGYDALFKGMKDDDPNPFNTEAMENAGKKMDDANRAGIIKAISTIPDGLEAAQAVQKLDPGDKYELLDTLVNPDGSPKTNNQYYAHAETARHDKTTEAQGQAKITMNAPLVASQTAANNAGVGQKQAGTDYTKAKTNEIPFDEGVTKQKLRLQAQSVAIALGNMQISAGRLGLDKTKWENSSVNPQSSTYDASGPIATRQFQLTKLINQYDDAATKSSAAHDAAATELQIALGNSTYKAGDPAYKAKMAQIKSLEEETQRYNAQSQQMSDRLAQFTVAAAKGKVTSRSSNNPKGQSVPPPPGGNGANPNMPSIGDIHPLSPFPGFKMTNGVLHSPDGKQIVFNGHVYDSHTGKLIH